MIRSLTFIIVATTSVIVQAADLPAIIPLPQKITQGEGAFTITSSTRVYADSASKATAEYLAKDLRQATSYSAKVTHNSAKLDSITNGILLTTEGANTNLGAEGYDLTVTTNSVVIRAPEQAGLFYGVQTLLQLLPPQIYASNRVTPKTEAWQVPCVQIEDWPRFQWRGFMLDVSRHFYNVQEVEKILDGMALHKMNTFHWHLTDDHGWRIQIKKYPKLTEVGAWRDSVGFGLDPKSTTAYGPDGRYGGFYTPKDIHAVVKYAAERHIEIVPEIEMPGHATAALSAYPQYSCTGGPFTPSTNSGIFTGIYDPAKEETYQFLGDIISEVVTLFPGRYIHIGGDEVPKETWKKAPDCQALMKREGLKNEDELQSWFTRRIEKIVTAHGRSMIGWSEILQGGLPQSSAVMDWIGGAKEAASNGHNVVMTPTAYCYFDFYQSSNHAAEPKAAQWGGPLTLSKMYSFEPMPTNVPPQLQSYILGAQGNLWTEEVPNLKHVEYMAFPRMSALAEVDWSAKDARNWDDFMRRMQVQATRFDALNINYRHGALDTPEASWKK